MKEDTRTPPGRAARPLMPRVHDLGLNEASHYFELVKPRILTMVLVTTYLGFFLGARGAHQLPLALLVLSGVGCATGGSATLNNYLERNSDAKMSRTRGRPLPAGLVEPSRALPAGAGLVLIGVLLVTSVVNLLAGFLVLLAAFLYVLVYTPPKLFGALAIGTVMLGSAMRFAWRHEPADARGLLRTSLFYLPALLLLIVLDAS